MTGLTFILGVALFFLQSRINECSEIVSQNRPTTQSSNYTLTGATHYSGNAVDGNYYDQQLNQNSCAHQAENQTEVWWRVDLQREVTVEKVEIYYRDEGSVWDGWKNRFAGYEVYLSNTTERHIRERCFIDESEDVNQIVSHVNHSECNGTAQYVTIYNHRDSPKRQSWYFQYAVLELCEVQVYGCKTGKYGIGNCDRTCSTNCPGGVCHPSTGRCLYCGDNTYTRYGETSCRPCPESCAGQCGRIGNCIACKDGFYGSYCQYPCSSNCDSSGCEKTGGYCKACKDGFYGSYCRFPCSSTCDSSGCEKNTGYCKVCQNGRYGSRCTDHCPYICRNDECEMKSGNCSDCNDGYYGPTCTECPPNCASKTCDFSGHCTACINGTYGTSCGKTCGNCDDRRCDKTTGYCETCQNDWTGQRCDVKADKQSGGDYNNVATYAGAAVGAVVSILLIVIVVIVVVKRRLTGSRKMATSPSVRYETPIPGGRPNNHSNETEDHVYMELEDANLQDSPNDQENAYYNEVTIGYPVSKLKPLINEKVADDAKQFSSDFKTFPVGATHPHTASKKNQSKNRYKFVHPYDHSRVILDTIPGENDSDYINANYIDSIEAKKFYVATQGPLPNTIDDFWRMIWFLNSGKIVMLANLVENLKVKCDKYWPDEGDSMLTKTFDISLNLEHVYASCIVRNITVVDRKTMIKREIQQFHFTNWTDHDTPNTLDLVLFHRRVKLHKTALPGQMVIHCSAGAGRTGIFIAFDALLEFGKKHNRIDIEKFIHTMYNDRMNMVQTVDQYVALHEMLAEAFDLQDSLIPKSMFAAKYHALSVKKHAASNQTQLSDEFKLIWDQRPDYKEKDFQAALLPENRTKNRTMRILAVERFRACLKSHASNSNDYINAVNTQSYTDQQGYIVTQFPLEDTCVDFWTLVMDYQSDTIVILGDPKQDAQWIPTNKENVNINDFTVQQNGTLTQFQGVDVIDVLVKRKNEKTEHSGRLFHMKEWTMERQVPPSKQSILRLLEQVETRRRSNGNKPVIVTCLDGATQCGLFCLMANTRDQIKMDEEVDVFQAARQLLVRRPEFLNSFDQYQFCYEMLKDYVETTDVYIN